MSASRHASEFDIRGSAGRERSAGDSLPP